MGASDGMVPRMKPPTSHSGLIIAAVKINPPMTKARNTSADMMLKCVVDPRGTAGGITTILAIEVSRAK